MLATRTFGRQGGVVSPGSGARGVAYAHGLFLVHGVELLLDEAQRLVDLGQHHVLERARAACPDLVYPNYQDWGYAKVQLDQRSFDTARTKLSQVDDPLLRGLRFVRRD